MKTIRSLKTKKKIKTNELAAQDINIVQSLHSIYMSPEPPSKRQRPWITEYKYMCISICVCVCILNSEHTFPVIEVKLLLNALHIGGGTEHNEHADAHQQ